MMRMSWRIAIAVPHEVCQVLCTPSGSFLPSVFYLVEYLRIFLVICRYSNSIQSDPWFLPAWSRSYAFQRDCPYSISKSPFQRRYYSDTYHLMISQIKVRMCPNTSSATHLPKLLPPLWQDAFNTPSSRLTFRNSPSRKKIRSTYIQRRKWIYATRG
jgi:hypothetical protein